MNLLHVERSISMMCSESQLYIFVIYLPRIEGHERR
jgi:hypothetical protein